MAKFTGLILFILILALAAWLRFDQPGLKPFHHDEGVNAYFLLNLARRGVYKYDPTNYHGPTIYYFGLISVKLLGENDLALRFWPALFGLLTVALVWPLRKRLGVVGTLAATVCLALSPGLVYFSRDFIHEMSFGFFSLGIVVGALLYRESGKFAWLVLMAVSAGLLFASKETAIMTVVVLALAVVCATIWDLTRRLIREKKFSLANLAREMNRELRMSPLTLDHALAALIIFVFINIFFYSSLFTHWQGVTDAVRSIFLWTERSGTEHVKSFNYYLGILLKFELPILVGSLLGGIFVILRGTRFWLFIAAWAIGMTLAYSIIGYKTPWLMINFLIPMGLMAGYAAQQTYDSLKLLPLRLLWIVAIAVAMIPCFRLTRALNFERYDDNSNSGGYFSSLGERYRLRPYLDGQYGYVYAQTDRDFLNLVRTIEDEAERRPGRRHTAIRVASPDYWPLPWYLRDYDQIAYTGSLNTVPGQAGDAPQPIVIVNQNQRSLFEAHPEWKASEQTFTLRPGVELMIFVRDETPK